MKSGLHYLVAVSALCFFRLLSTAQPVNDNPCGAITLTVAETADACTPTVYTMVNPTYLNLSLPDPGSCPGPVVLPTYPDYWFRFTATSTSGSLNFIPENGTTTQGGTFGTGANYFVVYKADNCNGPFTLTMNCGRTDILYTRMLSNLQIGGVYYIRVVSALSNVGTANFGICVSTNMPPASSRVGINVTQPNTNLDVAGTVTFRNDVNFQGRLNYYGAGEYSQSGQPDSMFGRSAVLRFSDGIGKKIILGNGLYFDQGYPGGTNGQGAIGVGSGTLQLQYPSQFGGGVQFGYGNGISAFTQTVLISGTGHFAANGNGSFGGILTTGGNVGLGLTGPAARLSISTTGTQLAGSAMSNALRINAGNLGTSAGNELNIASLGFIGGNNISLGIRGYRHTAGTDWTSTSVLLGYDVDNTIRAGGTGSFLALAANGNVGIKNANPRRPLSFPAELGEKILLYPGANGEVGIGVYGNELRLHSDNPGAKVSFGTQDNAGNFTEVGKFEKNGAYGLAVFGSIWANGTTYASDGRYKKNIVPLENSLDKVLQLQGVSYQMKTEAFPGEHFDEAQQVGLVAQEVEKIVPEVVITGPSGYKAIDYAKLVPLLIEAIKQQQKEIDALKKKSRQKKGT